MGERLELLSVPFVGVLSAVGFLLILLLNGSLICKRQPVLGFIICSTTVGSILSIGAWLSAPLLGPIMIFVLITGAVLCLKDISKSPIRFSDNRYIWPFLGFITFFAAVPYLRYDQWNYHLVIPKYLSLLGKLPENIYDDHIYFTGGYEFLVGLFRLFSRNDIYFQSFVNVFSLLSFLLITYGALNRLYKVIGFNKSTSILPLTSLILFLFPDFMALSNAKADILLMPIALYTLALYPFSKSASFKDSIFFGIALTIPLALKITWLVFAAALGLVFIVDMVLRRQWKHIFFGALGAAFGLPFIGLVLFKTWYFLGNPLHPTQTFLFSSTYWSSQALEYWDNINHFVHGFNEWISSLPAIVIFYFKRLSNYVGFAFILLILLRVKNVPIRDILQKHKKLLLITGLTFLVFFALWPLAFGQSTAFERLKEASFALIIPVIVICFHGLSEHSKMLKWLVIITLIGTSKIDVRADDLRRYFSSVSVRDYYENKSKPYVNKIYAISQIVESHRAKLNGDFDDHITLGNSPSKYFFSKNHIDVSNYNLQIIARNRFQHTDEICVWDLYKAFHVSYLIDFNYRKIAMSEPFHQTKTFGEKLSDHYEIYYFSEDLINRLIEQECSSRVDNVLKLNPL